MTTKHPSPKSDERTQKANLGQKDAREDKEKQSELAHTGELSKSTEKNKDRSQH